MGRWGGKRGTGPRPFNAAFLERKDSPRGYSTASERPRSPKGCPCCPAAERRRGRPSPAGMLGAASPAVLAAGARRRGLHKRPGSLRPAAPWVPSEVWAHTRVTDAQPEHPSVSLRTGEQP